MFSLSGGIISNHSLPNLEKVEFLDIDQIIDFEIYSYRINSPIKNVGPIKQYYMATLQPGEKGRLLKIFQILDYGQDFKQITKVSLEGPSGLLLNEQQDALNKDAANPALPVFDGGIAVFRDNFVIQYKNSAEFIKIENKGTVMETVVKKKLWDFAEPEY